METDEYSKCAICREKERIRDKNKRSLSNLSKKNPTKELSLENQLYNQYATKQQNKKNIKDDDIDIVDDINIDDIDIDDINIDDINIDDNIDKNNGDKNNNEIKPHRLSGCQGYLYNRTQCQLTKIKENGYCYNHQRFASLKITPEELDDIRNGTEYTNIRLSKASGNNGQWVRIEGQFKTSLKQRLQKRIIDKKRSMEGGSKKIWIENNPEKISKYDLDHKAKRIETEGEQYWIKNAEQAKKWREVN
jgi:hypothetical protein